MKKLLFLILLAAIYVVSRQGDFLGKSYSRRSEYGCRKKRGKKRRRKTPAQTTPYGKVDYHSPAESVFGDQGTRGMASPSLDVSGMSESGTFGR